MNIIQKVEKVDDGVDDLHKGEIYIIRCTVTGKGYVGQAPKYITENKQKWGHKGRWTRHVYEAKKKLNKTTLLTLAIREHGKENFKVEKICDCLLGEMDYLESQYIIDYNTLEPNGYNMTTGGQDGLHSETSNIKKSEGKIKAKLKEKVINSEQDPNAIPTIPTKPKTNNLLGVRREEQDRKRPEDNELPKYVYPIRKNDIIIGYQVKKFPLGITVPEYIYKTFKNKDHPEVALKLAADHVDKLHGEYAVKLENHKKKLADELKEKEIKAELAKAEKDKDNTHQYIYKNIVNNKLDGYYVKWMKDYKNNYIPRRDFTKYSNSYNLEHALKFVKMVENYNNIQKIPEDWVIEPLPKNKKPNNLPNHMRLSTYNGKETGYRIEYFVKYDEDGKQVVESKNFSNKKQTMQEKYDLAVKYIEMLDEKYQKKSALNSEL